MPAAAAAHGVTASSVHHLEGKIVSVNRTSHTFRMRDHHRGIVKIQAVARTRYERLSGFRALHKGLRVDVTANRSNGHWVALKIERRHR